jgi:hypothetical protein
MRSIIQKEILLRPACRTRRWTAEQGDQIGLILTYLAIVLLLASLFLHNIKVVKMFLRFFDGYSYV